MFTEKNDQNDPGTQNLDVEDVKGIELTYPREI